jgi:hypothetical protein
LAESNKINQLSNEFIINSTKTSTRYKILEVSTAETNPKVRVERIEGIEPIPVGVVLPKFILR